MRRAEIKTSECGVLYLGLVDKPVGELYFSLNSVELSEDTAFSTNTTPTMAQVKH